MKRANTSEALLAKADRTCSASPVDIRVIPDGVELELFEAESETQVAREDSSRTVGGKCRVRKSSRMYWLSSPEIW
jgi:hypothetical protein